MLLPFLDYLLYCFVVLAGLVAQVQVMLVSTAPHCPLVVTFKLTGCSFKLNHFRNILHNPPFSCIKMKESFRNSASATFSSLILQLLALNLSFRSAELSLKVSRDLLSFTKAYPRGGMVYYTHFEPITQILLGVNYSSEM